MNKKLKEYFEQLGFSIEGNNAHGEIDGYEVSANVAMLDNVSPVKMHVNLYATEVTKLKIVNEIQALKFKYFFVAADLYGISLGFNDPLTVGKLLNRMPDMLDSIFKIFRNNDAKGVGHCPICGNELSNETKKYRLDWALISMDSECVKGINNIIEESNKDFNEQPNNYIHGAIGAIIGSIVGVISYIVLFFMGFISALSSFISILLGEFLCKKFKGKPNAVMIVIVSVVSIVSMILTAVGLYIFAAQMLAYEYYFSSTGIQAFKDMMTVPEFKSEFVSNLVMTIVFTLLGVVFEIIKMTKSIKRQGKIQ